MTAFDCDVCVVGLGPAGMGATLALSRARPTPRVVCLEAGEAPSKRLCTILDNKGCRRSQPCQMISGVGGCSLLAGGKISTFPAGRALSAILGGEEEARRALDIALSTLAEFLPLIPPKVDPTELQGAMTNYEGRGFQLRYYDAYLYRQVDLVHAYERILREVEQAGVSVLLGGEVVRIRRENLGFLVNYAKDGTINSLMARQIVLATGRLGKPLLTSLRDDMSLKGEENTFDVGVRLEFPSDMWPDFNRCHNDLKLHFDGARTFCVCHGGTLAPYRWGDIFLLEGYSDPELQTDFTNLGIVCRCSPSDGATADEVLAHIRTSLLATTNGLPARELLGNFLDGNSNDFTHNLPSSIRFWRWGSARSCFPNWIQLRVVEAVRRFASTTFSPEAYSFVSVFAPEMDYFWHRYPINEHFQSTTAEGVFLIGDAAGQFRGILQAFCSGQLFARSLSEG